MKLKIIHFLALAGVLGLLYGHYIEPYWIEVKPVDIYTEKLENTSIRIVQISDLHSEGTAINEDRIAGLVNPLKPDIIVFTGDSLNAPEGLPVFRGAMKKLDAAIGKYAVRGNFDVWYWKGMDLFDGTGFVELDKKSVRLAKGGEAFYISGLSYEHGQEWRDVLKDIPPDGYSILLYHTPDLVEDLKEANIDLYLAGHTHGGQVAVPFYGALITLSKYGKKYESGRYAVGNTTLYVNRGLGMEGGLAPRGRFWSRPEITVFNIKPTK